MSHELKPTPDIGECPAILYTAGFTPCPPARRGALRTKGQSPNCWWLVNSWGSPLTLLTAHRLWL